jgi:hypothetical protein
MFLPGTLAPEKSQKLPARILETATAGNRREIVCEPSLSSETPSTYKSRFRK